MKTAMQELWEYIEANSNEENFNIFDAKSKSLHLEKKQIIDAYEASEMNENETRYKIVAGERFYSYEHAEDYYKETYDKKNG